MPEQIVLDARLGAIAALALETFHGIEHPYAADIGCDHGYLSAYLLEHQPGLTMIASDVSAPSLEKARRKLMERGLDDRVLPVVADGLTAIDRPVQAVVIAGMGGQLILRIVSAGAERIGNAALIVQANTDVPRLRAGLSALGFTLEREVFSVAAERHYVTLCLRKAEPRTLTAREALLGAAANGIYDPGARIYFAWQRNVYAKKMAQAAAHRSPVTLKRLAHSSQEMTWISEVLGMKTCTVSDMVAMVGQIAPFETAEPWDNVGLLLGSAKAEVTRVLVSLDLTQESVEQALALDAQLIVTHHPIMFSARKRITDDDREGRLMLSMLRAGIAHIAAHTNLDRAPGGVNDTLMARMGCSNVRGEGFVRVGDLPEEMTFDELRMHAEKNLHAVVRTYGTPNARVHCLGCCSGSGGGEVAEAKALGADCFLTGEIRHHEALDAVDAGVFVLEAGHFETENPVCEVLANALQNAADALEYKVTVFCAKDDPFARG